MPGPPGESDLRVFLKHQAVFQHHRQGTYGVWVTNTRSAPLAAGQRTMITVTVWINAKAGATRHSTATVNPSDSTPADNSSTDKAIIRKH